jgi:hypothetical protein
MAVLYIFTHCEYYFIIISKGFILFGLKYLPDWIFRYINKLFEPWYKINIKCLRQFHNDRNIECKYKNIPYKLIFYFNWWWCCNYEYINIYDLRDLYIISEFAIIYNDCKYLYINLVNQTYLYLEKDILISRYGDLAIQYINKNGILYWYSNDHDHDNAKLLPFTFGLLPIKL